MAAPEFFNELFALDGKVALVTGGSAGIGLGIAEVLARAGAKVVISGRNLDNAEEAASQLREEGLDVAAVRLDPADEQSIVEACGEVIAAQGPPWILVNNAGKQDGEFLLEATSEHWDETYAINLRWPMLLIREIGQAMVDAGEGGRVINISSRAAQGRMMAGLGAYVASKTAMGGLSMASATELVEHGITVNTLLPGGVMTPGGMSATRPPVDPDKMPPRPPMGMSTPQDIGAAVLFFASPAAHKITNQVVALDAGFSVVL
ncbi:MAG: SDR family NAD(P)-dependent oxidoreductase [Novosphingobium sp.]|nr:SDR family NAD(P)-dependent oxidoreductase [Novosphingobium sp.]